MKWFVFLFIFLTITQRVAAEDENSCEKIPGHVGIADLVFGSYQEIIGVDKNISMLKGIKIDKVYTGEGTQPEQLPIPCHSLLEVTGSQSKGQDYQIQMRTCENSWVQRKISGVKSDSKYEKKVIGYNFETEGKELRDAKFLRTLYSGDGVLNKSAAAKLNDLLKSKNCALVENLDSNADGGKSFTRSFKKIVNIKSSSDFINCAIHPNHRDINKSNAEKMRTRLAGTCAISDKSSAVGDLFFYDAKATQSENFNQLKACARHFSESPKGEMLLPLSGSKGVPKYKFPDTDSFSSLNHNCELVSTKKIKEVLQIIPQSEEIARNFSDDISTCENCNGLTMDGAQISFASLIEKLDDPCSQIGELIEANYNNEECQALTCTKINKCMNASQVEPAQSILDVSYGSYGSVKDSFNDKINRDYILPMYQAVNIMAKNKRELSAESLTDFSGRIERLQQCSSKLTNDKIVMMYLGTPSATSKFLAESLSNLKKLNAKLSPLKDHPNMLLSKSPELLKDFASYTAAYKALPEDEAGMENYKAGNADCNILASLMSHPGICHLTKSAMEKENEVIAGSVEKFTDDNQKKLDKYKDKSIKEMPEKQLEVLTKYLDGTEKSFRSTKEGRLALAEHMSLQEEAQDILQAWKFPVERNNCDDTESIVTQSQIEKVFGVEGERLDLKDLNDKETAEVVSEEVDEANEELKSQIADLQQQLAALMSGMGGGGMGMMPYASGTVDIFSQMTNAFADWGTLTTESNIKMYDIGANMFNTLHADSLTYSLQSQQMYHNSLERFSAPVNYFSSIM